ncbi:hypothetical protein SAM23877_6279 [Streptomyces ambofaciens ATCC 23877]|uniref:Uncharacterized protein n=2 Tax=Streptomyces ambofaciens TaxID=1889 RepID=A0A0K2B218_STRA7|nr:hypothetical protein SAM23877_6279 [Streptomyces ambofaciens ATCC 23877]
MRGRFRLAYTHHDIETE